MRARVGHQLDIIYVGFVLGHGGDALQMLSLAHGMRLRGANVKIIVPNTATTAAFPARCAAVGIECERSDLITADMEGARQSLRAVIRLLRSLDAPLVHFHTGNSCLPRKVMLALELLRFRPAFVTIHSPYETIVPGGARARFWAGTAGRRFLAVVSPSKHATFFQERCGLRSDLALTVRNTIDIETAASGDGRGPRAELGVDADDPIVLFCSRIDAQKRPVDAVQAFAAVADEFPKALLVFVGVGDCVDAVALEATRLGVHGRVRLLGYQTNVPDWLAASTVWILPTERENFSVAVLEALAAGCAVLATNCPGNDEVLVDHENAICFAIGDVDCAANGLQRLLRDPSLRQRIQVGARGTAESYRLDTMVQGYLDVYARSGPLAWLRPVVG